MTSILAQLQDGAKDDAVVALSIQGAGERGLTAAGNVRAIALDRHGGVSGRSAVLCSRVPHERRLGSYPNPFVAFMDGIVMGGGAGIWAHGSLRLVTERSRVATPEAAIGLSPDVGSTFLAVRRAG